LAKSIFKPGKVQSALRTLQKRLNVARKRVNAEAASQMKAGRYDAAKGVMEIGSSLSDFVTRVDSLSEGWETFSTQANEKAQQLGLGTAATTESKRTSVRKLSIPALRAILAHGGDGEIPDIIPALESSHAPTLTEADRAVAVQRGVPQWHLTLEKAYRYCQRKGWIEKRNDGIWKVTAQGELIAGQDT